MIHGTTIFLGDTVLETIYGTFKAYIYLDIITKGNIIALIWDSIDPSKESTIYTRIHSSCVTSETLRSMDCDCVSQLHGALEFMASKQNGILFYLIQEGRGCGYIGKARACMMTQYQEELDTFQAYTLLGMKKDYREYRNIKDICIMLDIKADFVLLTNNPDKINGLTEQGISIKSVQSIEIKPNPFNQSYLISKEKSGHLLMETKKKLNRYNLPHDSVKPFAPHKLKSYPRFITCASYYIPVNPVDNMIILSKTKYNELKADLINVPFKELSNDNILIKLSNDIIMQNGIDNPYWFKVNLFYDIATDKEYVILSYNENVNTVPIIRIHSESIFNRFPLKVQKYKDRYTESLLKVVENDSGYIVLLYNDGRGAGLGNLLLNMDKSNPMGIESDVRDYDACLMLLKTLMEEANQKSAKMMYSNFSRQKIQKAIDNVCVNITNWIPISDNKGHKSIENRINNIQKIYNQNQYIQIINEDIDVSDHLIVTGIGSSKAHAKYLEQILKNHMNIHFMSVDDLYRYDIHSDFKLIIFSQGLSPNTHKLFEMMNYENIILVTAVPISVKLIENQAKANIMSRLLDGCCTIINIPGYDENDTLIRITGPFFGFIACQFIKKYALGFKININVPFDKLRFDVKFADSLIKQISNHAQIQLCVLARSPNKDYMDNCLDKMTEGLFIGKPGLCDFTEFVHGHYQSLVACPNPFVIIINSSSNDNNMINRINDMLSKDNKFNIWEIKLKDDYYSNEYQILELEYVFNLFVHYMMCNLAIDQVTWPGKSTQYLLYDY